MPTTVTLGDYLPDKFHLLAPAAMLRMTVAFIFSSWRLHRDLNGLQHQSVLSSRARYRLDKPCHAIGTAGQCHLPLHVSDKNLIDARNILHREICSVNLRQ